MQDDEAFFGLYAKSSDIVNSSFNLGEKIGKSKVVKKKYRFF